jgi:general secretion pathway protein D
MVFLRPVVMRDAEAGLKLTNSKYDFIRAKQLGVREDGVGLISDDEAPVLPDFQQYLTAPSASEKQERAEPAVEPMP